jgi:hypothetical protein
MTREMYEELKSEIFMGGLETVEDVLNYEINPEEDDDTIDRRLDMALEEMSEDEVLKLYNKYCKDVYELTETE